MTLDSPTFFPDRNSNSYVLLPLLHLRTLEKTIEQTRSPLDSKASSTYDTCSKPSRSASFLEPSFRGSHSISSDSRSGNWLMSACTASVAYPLPCAPGRNEYHMSALRPSA